MWTTANRPLSERPDWRGMGAFRSADSRGQTWWPQAQGRCARSCEWDHVRVEHGVPMALCAQGPSAQEHALRLFRSLDLRRHGGEYPSCALCEVPRTNRTRGQPHRRYHRQPEREKRRKRGRCIDPSGYDAGKKINGKKRHILVDALGLLLHAIVHPADIQDRDGGMLVVSTLFGMYPFLQKLFADGGYQGPVFQKALAKALPHLEIEIVKRPDHAKGFEVLPQRWVVERTFAWLNRCRRLAKDFENLTRNALAFLRLASIRFMLRKLCNQ